MSPGRSTTSEPQSVRVTRGGDEVSREIRETRVKGGGRTRGKRSRDLTSAVVRHARGARVLVIHVTPVHDASRRRVSAIRSSRGCANDVVADAASGSISRRRRKKIAKTSFSSKLRVLAGSGRGSAQPASARRRARGMAKDKAPAKSGKATAEPRHDPGWERVRTRFLARLCQSFPRSLPREPSSNVVLLFSSTQAVESGVWDRPADALPDASDWPTWGALRERILMNAKEVRRASPEPARSPRLHDDSPILNRALIFIFSFARA